MDHRGDRGTPDRVVVVVSIQERSGARSGGENIVLLDRELARCFPRPHSSLSQPVSVRRVRPANDQRRPPERTSTLPVVREARETACRSFSETGTTMRLMLRHDPLLSFDDPIKVPACVESHLQSPRECQSHPSGSHLQAAPESRAGCPANRDS